MSDDSTPPLELEIVRDRRLDRLEVARLLQQHLDAVVPYSPAESRHALDLTALRAPEVSFFCAWSEDRLAGCGALRELSTRMGEIKSMKTAPEFLRRGVGARVLEHLLGLADDRGYDRLSLETGSHDYFEPARALYRRFGFESCEPFGDYVEDPYSVFMTKRL